MAFKSIDLKATKDGLPEVWGTSEVSPLITQAYCLKRVSRPRYKGGKPVDPSNFFEFGMRTWKSGKKAKCWDTQGRVLE